ncbi:unnamed protein product [Allacma fusca]|uniref:Reverse transcriptase domain-containing protein n=1 Tax=Allacma fusca TaxID=39272 RepID=A0A8J2Q0R1_9HEXA|nr:unnamed protein product [Allacma fusca]
MKIRASNGSTKFYDITRGVLQGEILSPLLFALFISDLDKVLQNNECAPVSLGGSQSVNMLMFADDIVTLAGSKQSLQHKINCLSKYCESNELEINLSKTKDIVFRKGGKLCKSHKWYLSDKSIEIVKNNTYLGIVFSSSGVFYDAMLDRSSKAKRAVGNVVQLGARASMYSWAGRCKIFDTICKNSLLYGAPIWAVKYLDYLELSQTALASS